MGDLCQYLIVEPIFRLGLGGRRVGGNVRSGILSFPPAAKKVWGIWKTLTAKDSILYLQRQFVVNPGGERNTCSVEKKML